MKLEMTHRKIGDGAAAVLVLEPERHCACTAERLISAGLRSPGCESEPSLLWPELYACSIGPIYACSLQRMTSFLGLHTS